MKIGIGMGREYKRTEAAFGDIDVELLLEFPHQRGFRGFARVNLSAGKLPKSGQGFARRSLSDQDAAVDIDESDGGSDCLARTMSAIAEQAPSVSLSIDELLSPSRAKETVSSVNGGDTLVLVHATEPLLPKHYARLQGLVNYHALEEWRNNGTEREIVRFGDGSRFVLVLSRKLFEETLREYPQLRGILGISMSLDDARKREVL